MIHCKLKLIQPLVTVVQIALLTCLHGCKEKPLAQQILPEDSAVKHFVVYHQNDKFAGWPANWGIWNWGEEILVGFTLGDHLDTERSHTFDRKSAFSKFARSKDGGLTWQLEDAYDQGITESTVEHNLGDKSIPAQNLTDRIDFSHPDFALTFRMRTMRDGPTSFYYSYDRGSSWHGAYHLKVDFPERSPAGIVSRTDYIIDGPNTLTAFLTVGFRQGENDWREVACVRTTDGGLTWNHVSWVTPPGVNSIMPSSVRLSPERILTTIRRHAESKRMVSYLSEDNGKSWSELPDPVSLERSNPPALLQLKDNRLCLVYGQRTRQSTTGGIGIYVTYSSDEGTTWSKPKQIRGDDGANWDIGYLRAIERPDGKVVAVYYYNNAEAGEKYRYIAASVFDPKLHLY